MNQRRKQRLEREYQAKLDLLIDDIFELASDNRGWSWVSLAEESCMSYNTVYRLGMRLTKWPRLQTIYKLAAAVGMDLNLVQRDLRGVRIAA